MAFNNIPVLAGESSLQTIKVLSTDSWGLCCVKLLTVKTTSYFDSPMKTHRIQLTLKEMMQSQLVGRKKMKEK